MSKRTIGNYEVTSLLGEGGMGRVYLARHASINRMSAVKILHPDLTADPKVVGRFFREARAADAIQHPNIVSIYDCGTLPDGAPYIVMEYLEGETLARRLAHGALTMVEAVEFTRQAASALGAAHRKGIVHRDLKPENLFLVADPRRPGRDQVKVLDFGLAKLMNGPDGASTKTRDGALVGTPLYMSPEQCRGMGEVDARSDVYSLGVILFEMLCGRPPFSSQGVGELINLHINYLPPAPRTLNGDIPAALEAIVLRCLAKHPDQRFQTMEELLAALHPLALPDTALPGRGRPGRASPPPLNVATTIITEPTGSLELPTPMPSLVRELSPRRRWFLTAVALVELAAAFALAWAWWHQRTGR